VPGRASGEAGNETARIHQDDYSGGPCLAARGPRTTAGSARYWLSKRQIGRVLEQARATSGDFGLFSKAIVVADYLKECNQKRAV
jgi:hypothetical protein